MEFRESTQSCPISIKLDPVHGRFLESRKDVQEGGIIFQEHPVLIGPRGVGIEKSKPFSTCLGCYKIVNSVSPKKCSKCGWPMCSSNCEKIPDHANFECTVFADCPVSPVTNPLDYEKIKVLRCLMLKEKDPEKWTLLMGLQSHIKNRKQDVYAISRDISFYKFIRDECHLKQFSFEEISHFAGVCAINSYSTNGILGNLNSDGCSRYASFLFYYASLLSHDCLPNARAVIQQKGRSYVINLIATTRIRVGDPLYISYVDPNFATLERRNYLLDHFHFACKCQRCRDPTELGSFLSAVKCKGEACTNGWLLPRFPLDPNSVWVCSSNACNTFVDPSKISNILQEVKTMRRKSTSLNDFAEVLQMYKGKVLHKNHHFVINMEFEMLRIIEEMLPKGDETEIFNLSKWQLEICRHCLSVADLIQPGNTKYRGQLLYYLQDALLSMCSYKVKQCCDAKDLDIIRKQCKKQFAEALEIMKESKSILMTESVGSQNWQKGTLLSLESPRVKTLMSCLSFKD